MTDDDDIQIGSKVMTDEEIRALMMSNPHNAHRLGQCDAVKFIRDVLGIAFSDDQRETLFQYLTK